MLLWFEIDQAEVLFPDQPVFVNLLDDSGDEWRWCMNRCKRAR